MHVSIEIGIGIYHLRSSTPAADAASTTSTASFWGRSCRPGPNSATRVDDPLATHSAIVAPWNQGGATVALLIFHSSCKLRIYIFVSIKVQIIVGHWKNTAHKFLVVNIAGAIFIERLEELSNARIAETNPHLVDHLSEIGKTQLPFTLRVKD